MGNTLVFVLVWAMVFLTFPTHEVVGNTPVLNIIVILELSTITVSTLYPQDWKYNDNQIEDYLPSKLQDNNLLCNKAINLQIPQEIEILIKPLNVTTMVLNLDIYLILFKLLRVTWNHNIGGIANLFLGVDNVSSITVKAP